MTHGARKLPPGAAGCYRGSARPPARRSHRVRHAPKPKPAPIGPSRRHRERSFKELPLSLPTTPSRSLSHRRPPPNQRPRHAPASAHAAPPPSSWTARCCPSRVAPRSNHTSPRCLRPCQTPWSLDTQLLALPSAIAEIICTQSARYSPPPAHASPLRRDQPAARHTRRLVGPLLYESRRSGCTLGEAAPSQAPAAAVLVLDPTAPAA